MLETELFALTYMSCGLAPVCYPVLEVTAPVELFENGRWFHRAPMAGKGKPGLDPAATDHCGATTDSIAVC